jgi:hypothetical protein
VVERHAFVGIQGFPRGEQQSFVLVISNEPAGQEHDGQVDAMPA